MRIFTRIIGSLYIIKCNNDALSLKNAILVFGITIYKNIGSGEVKYKSRIIRVGL